MSSTRVRQAPVKATEGPDNQKASGDAVSNRACRQYHGSCSLPNNVLGPAAQATVLFQDAVHVLFGKTDQDLEWRFGIVCNMSSSREENHAAITGTVSSPNELRTAPEGALSQVCARNVPAVVGTEVEPRGLLLSVCDIRQGHSTTHNVAIRAKFESQSAFCVFDLV